MSDSEKNQKEMNQSEVKRFAPSVEGDTYAGSDLIDVDFYLRHYGTEINSIDVIKHYKDDGEKRGLKPNLLFDPRWYSSEYHLSSGIDLLENYALEGERCGRNPSPLFDIQWFREFYINYSAEIDSVGALKFYLHNRAKLLLSPNQFFDLKFYYENNPDVASATIDGFEHYFTWGVFEGRRASENFDANFVWQRYLGNNKSINPFDAFLRYGTELGWSAKRLSGKHSIAQEIRANQAAGPQFEARQIRQIGRRKAKAFAFYLPQFHAIPENDKWWGSGFTEWTNISRGVPRFAGHLQPKVPRDLGFYDLTSDTVIKRQIEMARDAGIFGFCYYYYNFDGKRLLEKPLDRFLALNDSNFPFCLMWANENWTRRWDGQEKDVLLAQTYNQDDEQALIADLAGYFKNPAYYRISGRPLFIVYRADVVPDCGRTLARWRQLFSKEHDLSPIIVMAQAFGNNDPRPYGFDAAIEFPPHKFGSVIPRANSDFEILDDDFRGDIRLYDDLVNFSLNDFPAEYPLIKTVVPGWDNDARKQGAGMVMQGSTPEKFERWVDQLESKLEANKVFGEKLIFVNAWNEWCEGAYLEPDTHFGFAFANSFARAISGYGDNSKLKILLVGHDAFPAGAQQLLYHIGAALKYRFGIVVSFILLGGGSLIKDYKQVGPAYVVDQRTDFWPELNSHIRHLADSGYSYALTNSVFSGVILDSLKEARFNVVSLIHELPKIIESHGGYGHIRKVFDLSHTVVFPNDFVKAELTAKFGDPVGVQLVRPQGIYKSLVHHERSLVRKDLNIPQDAKIVINVGYADLRKGVDLFVSLANYMRTFGDKYYFIWIGGRDPAIDTWLNQSGGQNSVLFLDFTNEIDKFICAANIFFLTSREDPFPSVVLEALALGVPVIAFENTGGASNLLLDERLGALVPLGDLKCAAEKIQSSIAKSEQDQIGDAADFRRKYAADHFDFGDYCSSLLQFFKNVKKISVIVPNYNYANYLEERLSSIFAQTYPIFEIIVLDDGSTDKSLAVIEQLAANYQRDFSLVENGENSGNVFLQWRKGLTLARGDYIWIAEADDSSEPSFLETLIEAVSKPNVLFGFCDSKAIDSSGALIYENYKGYYGTVAEGSLCRSELFDAEDFLSRYLSTRNMILNASSILWRRSTLLGSLVDLTDSEIADLKLAGDWKIYINACHLGGKIAYEAAPLNIHRRHSRSVTGSIEKDKHIEEVRKVHAYYNLKKTDSTVMEAQRWYIKELENQLK